MSAESSGHLPGIDVSHYQGEIDWSKVAASGMRFAFIKATDGTEDVDPHFSQNWAGAKNAGIVRGAYHFFRPGLDARLQAEHLQRVVVMDDLALPPALDVEVTDGVNSSVLQEALKGWLEAVQAAFGCTPIIYTDPSFWKQHVAGGVETYPLWLACYSDEPEVPAPWRNWTFWQYTDAGSVSGIACRVDLDYCALSYEQLRRLIAPLDAEPNTV